jgi:ATP-dependent Clp protease ATP-binding subunit ClpB
MNRLDKVVVFHPLQRTQLEQVLDIELSMVQQRVLETAKGQFLFRVTESGRDFLLEEGTDQRYGARHLKRAIERYVVFPMANLLATDQVHSGDLICIDRDGGENKLTFVREGENLVMPARRPEPPAAPARANQARGGRPVEAPGAPVSPEPTPRLAR